MAVPLTARPGVLAVRSANRAVRLLPCCIQSVSFSAILGRRFRASRFIVLFLGGLADVRVGHCGVVPGLVCSLRVGWCYCWEWARAGGAFGLGLQ